MYPIFYTVIFLVVCLAIYILCFSRKVKLPDHVQKKAQQHWKKILGYHDSKKSILEADKLLDYLLYKKGYTGSLGNKLKRAEKLFSHVNHIWFAHKIRNKIAHELDYHPSAQATKKALSAFKRAFKDLGVEL